MELIKEKVNVNQVCFKGSAKAYVDEDIIVPDVKPDILKILQLDADACITDKRVTDGRASVSGRVDLKILYVPDSDKENIKSIITSFDFSQNIDNSSIKDSMKPLVSASVENAAYSLINSRKLRVKVTVCLDYEIVEEKSIDIAVDCANSGDMEILKENISLQNCIGLSESEFSLEENIEIPSGQNTAKEILKADARITDCEYKPITGKIAAKGVAAVSVLYTDEEDKIRFTETEIPFTEIFECDGSADDTVCDIDYSITGLSCEIREDSDGDKRIISTEIGICAQIKATENVNADIIRDCYEPFMKTQLVREDTSLDEVVSRVAASSTVRETIEVTDGAPGVSGIYDVITRPYITNVAQEKGKLTAEGKIEAYILYLSDSSETPVYSMKRELPFSVTLDPEADGDDLVPEIKTEVKHTAYNLNIAGEIELRCVLLVSANVIRKRNIELIEDILTEGRSDDDRRGIVIYFVQPGDTLWEIAKRYAVPRDSVITFNNLSEDERITPGTRLFIPGR